MANTVFHDQLDLLIKAHYESRNHFARAAGIIPETLSKLYSRGNLPKAETLNLMLDVFSDSEQIQLVDAFMRASIGEKWETLYARAMLAAVVDEQMTPAEGRLITADRASGGMLSEVCLRLDGDEMKALGVTLSAIMRTPSKRTKRPDVRPSRG